MKKLLLHSLLFLGLAGAAGASSSAIFDEILEPYEEVRRLLLADSTDGIHEYAAMIRKTAETASEKEEVRPLLPKIAVFAGDLATALDLATAREAFYELSKMLVQYRAQVSGDDLPVVMYCPMAKRSWLQPAGEAVGNPYHGRKMADCGNVVGQ